MIISLTGIKCKSMAAMQEAHLSYCSFYRRHLGSWRSSRPARGSSYRSCLRFCSSSQSVTILPSCLCAPYFSVILVSLNRDIIFWCEVHFAVYGEGKMAVCLWNLVKNFQTFVLRLCPSLCSGVFFKSVWFFEFSVRKASFCYKWYCINM